MIYFKHSDLSDKYHVSLKTVHNWIDGAKQGKVNLKLHSVTNRTYVANTPENLLVLNDLSDKGKKYRNTLHHKIIEPKAEFYDILSPRQILDVITNLDVHKEIPKQYDYLKEGATNFDNWMKRLSTEDGVNNILSGTLELLRVNMEAIDRLLVDYKRVNIVDLGAGNAYPVKELLSHLTDKGLLNRYIALDISPQMLKIAENNVKEWFGTDAPFEGYVRDITCEQFDDILVNEMLDNKADETINIVLVFGGTPTNHRSYDSVFRTAYASMTSSDILITCEKPDTETSRRYFAFSTTHKLSPKDQIGYLLDLMNIDGSLYELEMGFDKEKLMRYLRIKLNTSITIKFMHGDIDRSINLEKGERILLLRIWHLTTLDVISTLSNIGFTLLQSSLTKDRQFFLSISGVGIKDSQPPTQQ